MQRCPLPSSQAIGISENISFQIVARGELTQVRLSPWLSFGVCYKSNKDSWHTLLMKLYGMYIQGLHMEETRKEKTLWQGLWKRDILKSTPASMTYIFHEHAGSLQCRCWWGFPDFVLSKGRPQGTAQDCMVPVPIEGRLWHIKALHDQRVLVSQNVSM